MAATATFATPANVGRGFAFPNRVHRGTLSVGVYATGGVAVSRTTFQLPAAIEDLIVQPAGGYVPEWDKANGKVKVYWQTDSDNGVALGEVDDTTDLSATGFNFTATGR